MNRRACLAALASGLAGVAGCLSKPSTSAPTDRPPSTRSRTSADGGDDPETATPTPLDVRTPAPGECDASPPPKPETRSALPDARDYPEQPSPLDRSSVRSFLETYEAAHRYNRLLAELAAEGHCVQYLETHADESSVTVAGEAFSATITTRGSYSGEVCGEVSGTDTPTPMPHADLAGESVRYVLTDRFLLREGVTVECW